MNLLPEISFIVAEYDSAGGYTLRALCRDGTECDMARMRKSIAAAVVCGHGVVTKPLGCDAARRVEADGATFLSTCTDDKVAFLRRERIAPLTADLAARDIYPSAWFCTGRAADLPLRIDTFGRRTRAATGWRTLLRPTDENSAVLQAVARYTYIPLLATFLLLLAANAMLAPRLNAERQRLHSLIAARESDDKRRSADDQKRQAMIGAFAARSTMAPDLLCDRIAASVPDSVRLRRMLVEPLTKRFEAGKPLQRRENTAVVEGEAPSSAAVSEFVAALAACRMCRTVSPVSVERERNSAALSFRIELLP